MINNIGELTKILGMTRGELLKLRRDADSYYSTRFEPKLDKKGNPKLDKMGVVLQREINPSHNQLKRIQTRLYRYLSSTRMPEYVHGSIKGKDNISNAKAHKGKKYKFELDLKDYYPSISIVRVNDTFRLMGFPAYIASYLTRLTTYKGHLPQGAPTSSVICNLVFLETDANISDYCLKNDITYTRYIDDLTFSSHSELRSHTLSLIQKIVADGFRINRKKTKLKKGPAVITGVVTRNNVLDVTKEFKKSISRSKNDERALRGKVNYMRNVKKNNFK